LLACGYFTCIFEQQGKQRERLSWLPENSSSFLPQFARAKVQLKLIESRREQLLS
jgi:hypothetical protein